MECEHGTSKHLMCDQCEYMKTPEDEVRVDALVKSQYHTNCHDCGQFLKRDRWVLKDHKWKKHGLCAKCFELYDPPEY